MLRHTRKVLARVNGAGRVKQSVGEAAEVARPIRNRQVATPRRLRPHRVR